MRRLFILCLVLLLASCAAPAAEPTIKPTAASGGVVPTAVPELATVVPAAAANTPPPTSAATQAADGKYQTFSDDKLGFAFKYPTGWTLLDRAPDEPPGVSLHGPSLGQGPEPIIFAITIDVEPVKGNSVKSIVDEQLAQIPKGQQGGITRQPVMVGGEQGEEVIGLPSKSGAIETFVLSQGEMFLIILQPYDPGNAVLLPYLSGARQAYDTVVNNWQWLR